MQPNITGISNATFDDLAALESISYTDSNCHAMNGYADSSKCIATDAVLPELVKVNAILLKQFPDLLGRINLPLGPEPPPAV